MELLLPLVLIFGVMYLLVTRPQQKKAQAHRALLASMEVGDVVVTSSGIYGAVAEIEDAVIWLEVAPEVELKIAKAAVAELIPDLDDDDDDASDDDDDENEDDELEAADAGDDEG